MRSNYAYTISLVQDDPEIILYNDNIIISPQLHLCQTLLENITYNFFYCYYAIKNQNRALYKANTLDQNQSIFVSSHKNSRVWVTHVAITDLQKRIMCILFLYNGSRVEASDYHVILASNRDEFYDRATKKMTIWSEEPVVVAGRDLEVANGGTWLAVSPTLKKIGVLLNLPGEKKENASSRGKIVAEYIKCNLPAKSYVESINSYAKDCNDFVFVSIEFGNSCPAISSYCNANDQLTSHEERCVGFGNSLPATPLKKVEAGREKLEDICNKFHKESTEKELIENLIALLKSNERHLPDEQLQTRRPEFYKELSSIYVYGPKLRYGTRTHTLVLLTKEGRLSVTEFTQQMPIDPENAKWEQTEFIFNI